MQVLFEAFHYRYHPALARLREIVTSGEIGELTEVDVGARLPRWAFPRDDIRFNYKLAGGAMVRAPRRGRRGRAARQRLTRQRASGRCGASPARWTWACTPSTCCGS